MSLKKRQKNFKISLKCKRVEDLDLPEEIPGSGVQFGFRLLHNIIAATQHRQSAHQQIIIGFFSAPDLVGSVLIWPRGSGSGPCLFDTKHGNFFRKCNKHSANSSSFTQYLKPICVQNPIKKS